MAQDTVESLMENAFRQQGQANLSGYKKVKTAGHSGADGHAFERRAIFIQELDSAID